MPIPTHMHFILQFPLIALGLENVAGLLISSSKVDDVRGNPSLPKKPARIAIVCETN
jgi:hypothetical protein